MKDGVKDLRGHIPLNMTMPIRIRHRNVLSIILAAFWASIIAGPQRNFAVHRILRFFFMIPQVFEELLL
jgi:hypothetical protein